MTFKSAPRPATRSPRRRQTMSARNKGSSFPVKMILRMLGYPESKLPGKVARKSVPVMASFLLGKVARKSVPVMASRRNHEIKLTGKARGTTLNARIVVEHKNPKRHKTLAWQRYEGYKGATTYGEFLKLGGTRSDYRYNLNHDYLKLG